MKTKMIRLRFNDKKKLSEGENDFRVHWNTNEDNDRLDIAIHEPINVESLDSQTFPYKLKEDEVSSFVFIINNELIDGKNLEHETSFITKKDENNKYEATYQFGISLSKYFKTKENFIHIFKQAIPQTEPKKIGPEDKKVIDFEFFAETEDAVKMVRLDRAGIESTPDEALWENIKKRWNNINNGVLKFSQYRDCIDKILCEIPDDEEKKEIRNVAKTRSPFTKSEEYNLIKFGTEFYMLAKFGLEKNLLSGYLTRPRSLLPYYELIIEKIRDDKDLEKILDVSIKDDCLATERDRISSPIFIELIWSYWMEQGMLVQTMNVINLRFQNIKGNNYVDRLQRFDTDPIRPLSNILWPYVQDEQHRLSLPRRLYEYDHEYGLTLTGRAVPRITPVDTRVQFLEAFHSLLNLCTAYFYESDDTTRIADAFPILNSLKEVHLMLAEGNHNAYGNLTWTARQEMMMMQYILARPEMREFLGGKVMVPYPESWMDRVDTMRNIQGWDGAGIVYYHELAVHGELILLSIRYGSWSDITLDRNHAANWAQSFRNSIQRYIHAYRAVTGVDLSVDQVQLSRSFAIQPAYLIENRNGINRPFARRVKPTPNLPTNHKY
jgi:hypothetical protein